MALASFAPLSTLGFDSGRFFDDFFGGGALGPWAGGGLLGAPRLGAGVSGALRPLYCDVVERDKEYEMRVDVPGTCRGRSTFKRAAASASAAVRHAAAREGARPHLACRAPPSAMPRDAPRRGGATLTPPCMVPLGAVCFAQHLG